MEQGTRVDPEQIDAATERLRALGLRVNGTTDQLVSALRDRRIDPTRTLEAQLLRAVAVGWTFDLEGPEDTVPGSNFLGFDPTFLTTLLAKMAALSDGVFAPARITDASRPAQDSPYEYAVDHVLSFEFAGRKHSVVMESEALMGTGCAPTLGRVFDCVNKALAAARAPLRFACIPDATPFNPHANAEYRVLAVRADALAALRELTPVVYGANAPAGAGGAWEASRVRSLEESVAPERRGVFDGERIESAGDYVDVTRELAALAGGALSLESVSCERAGDGFRLAFRANGRDYCTALPARGDFVALPELLAVLNAALAASGAARSLYEVRDAARGQEFAVAFLDAAEAVALGITPRGGS